MKIWLRLYGYEPCSWTTVYEGLRQAFIDAGDEICDFVGEPENPEEWIEVWWGDPQFWQWSKLPVRARISIALSEARSIRADGREKVIRNIQNSDLLICPSVAATTAFKEAPIDIPMRVVLFGVDPTEFSYVDRDWSGDLCFLHGGVTQFRKGSWMVPESFIKAFAEGDPVKLTIASPRSSPMFTMMRAEYENHPQMEFICDRAKVMSELYVKNHIYVSPHLSEGFGLMPLEAMATGMVNLVARCSAPREYFHSDYGEWIEMSENYAAIVDCLPDTAGYWRLPDMDSCAVAMREAFRSRDDCQQMGKLASEYVHSNLTWAHTVSGIKAEIQEVLDAKY